MIKRIPNRLRTMFFSESAITQVIKPSGNFSLLQIGRYAAAIDEEIVAVGSFLSAKKVFVFNISTNPAQQLAILSSPDDTVTVDGFGKHAVAVNRKHGIILIGAPFHEIASMLL